MQEVHELRPATEAVSRRRRSLGSPRHVVLLGALCVLAAWTVWFATFEAMHVSEGATTAGTFAPGETVHVGLPGAVEHDVSVIRAHTRVYGRVHNVATNVCIRRPNAAALGSDRGDVLDDYCERLVPLQRGVRLRAERPIGPSNDYVIVSFTPSAGARLVHFCGIDLTYHAGLRLGHRSKAGGYNAVFGNERSRPQRSVDEFGDEIHWPDSDALSC